MLALIFVVASVIAEEASILKPDTSSEIVSVISTSSHKYISNTSPTKIGVLFDITTSNITTQETSNKEKSTRQPYELAIVLDRSGSMYGDKIEQAKLAILSIIDNMIEGDIIHLVQYDHSVQILIEGGSKESQNNIIKAVNGITPGGSTNLFGGLSTAYNILSKSITSRRLTIDDRISHSRIFLFSDGLLNAGVTDTISIMDNVSQWKNEMDISICTFGIGYDFDKSLMTSIAESARGDFFFIDSPQSIAKVIEIARKDAASLIGMNGILKIKTTQNTKISHMYGRGSKLNDNVRYNEIKIVDLRVADSQYAIIEVLVESQDDKLGKQKIMEWELEYDDVLSKKRKKIIGSVQVEIIDAKDERLYSDDNIDNNVHVFWKVNEIRMIDVDILEKIEEENYDQAIKKRKLLFENVDSLRASKLYVTLVNSDNNEMFIRANTRILERMEDDAVEQKIQKIKKKQESGQRVTDEEKRQTTYSLYANIGPSQAPTGYHYEL